MTHSSAPSADDRSTVTGRRRIAFAVHTDEDGLSDLLVLIRSLVLTNPAVCEDFVVLHPGLADASFDALRRLHPRVVTRRAEDRRDVFRLEGYDTVVALDPGMVVVGDLGELLRMRHGVGAVQQLLCAGEPGERRAVLPDGLFVVQRADVGDALAAGSRTPPTGISARRSTAYWSLSTRGTTSSPAASTTTCRYRRTSPWCASPARPTRPGTGRRPRRGAASR